MPSHPGSLDAQISGAGLTNRVARGRVNPNPLVPLNQVPGPPGPIPPTGPQNNLSLQFITDLQKAVGVTPPAAPAPIPPTGLAGSELALNEALTGGLGALRTQSDLALSSVDESTRNAGLGR